jgi:hypothetical protein
MKRGRALLKTRCSTGAPGHGNLVIPGRSLFLHDHSTRRSVDVVDISIWAASGTAHGRKDVRDISEEQGRTSDIDTGKPQHNVAASISSGPLSDTKAITKVERSRELPPARQSH